jgi:hypothetical protein
VSTGTARGRSCAGTTRASGVCCPSGQILSRSCQPGRNSCRGAFGTGSPWTSRRLTPRGATSPITSEGNIHSVTNPLSRFTGALHVYGGDFFGIERSEWDPATLREQRYDVEKALRLFEEANGAAGT